MKRDNKKTFVTAVESTQKKGWSNDADMKGASSDVSTNAHKEKMPPEINGPKGPEPTRYGDWEQKGRCTDF